ncbi:MAG: hypothetical protein JSW07_12535, partial [bacterium]
LESSKSLSEVTSLNLRIKTEWGYLKLQISIFKLQINFKIQTSMTVGIRKCQGIGKNPNPRPKHINPQIFNHSIARYLKNKGFPAEWIRNFLLHAFYRTTIEMNGTLFVDEMQTEAERRLKK